nr:leucine-rich repeat domain-containing protein [Alloprevotella rava]
MKKIKLLLLMLLLSVIPTGLYAYTNGQIVKIGGMNYKVTSVALYQLAFLNAPGKVGHLVIPKTVPDGQGTTFTVTGVTFVGGYNCDKITSVKLPESITYLDAGIFKDASLETINIPKNVKRIEENANTQLKKVPKYTVDTENPYFSSDDKGALYSKNKKTLRFVPSDIPLVNGAYTVDSNVDSIKNSCFSLINGLKKIVLPPNLKDISVGYPSIAPIDELEEFEMPTGGTTLFSVKEGVLCKGDVLMFYPRAKKTEEYTVPDDITTLAGFAIAYPKEMKKINLNKVTSLAKSSLFSAYKLSEITLPKDLKKYNPTTKMGMEPGCFGACTKVEKYIVPTENTDFEAVDGVIYSKPQRDILYFYPAGKPGEVYGILSTTKVIEALSFWSVQNLKRMTFPAGLDSIKEEAFRQLPKLEKVAFEEPSNITHLGTAVFRACPKLTEVTLPSKVTSLDKPFDGCSNLETINVPNGSQLKTLRSNSFSTNKNLKHFNFQGTCQLEKIESNAFAYLKNLESFTFPKTVKEIETNAFRGCAGMKTAVFPSDAEIEVIGAGAFADCGLTNFTVPNNVKEIKREAFNKCTALTVVNISEKTTTISPEAFKGCSKLTELNVSKKHTVYSSVDGYLLTKNKETLVIFPPGKANDRFTLLPPSIKKIGDYAFFDCKELKNVVIPNLVESIGERSFGLCSNLNTITFLCENKINPANISQVPNKRSFDDGNEAPNLMQNIDIHVRKEKLSEYNSDSFYHGKFKSISPSFMHGTEEYIAVSDMAVDMLKTTSTDETFVFPAKVTHNSKNYVVSLVGDYAFDGVTSKMKEVVVTKDVTYVGAKAFMTDKDHDKSTIQSVFFIESNPTKEMLSTTRFDLDDTGNNYSEFAKTTTIYVKKTALPIYKTTWAKKVYNFTTEVEDPSPFDFTSQLEFKIKDLKIRNMYGTFAREFDVDFRDYYVENHRSAIAAFVASTKILDGIGDYGTTDKHVQMTSVDKKGGYANSYSYVPAYTGVLLKVLDKEATDADFYYTIGEQDNQTYTVVDNVMTGVTVNPVTPLVVTSADPIYLVQKGVFCKADGNIVKFPIHKAYMKFSALPAGARVFFDFDDTTTGIESVEVENTNRGTGTYYNLQGQRINKPQQAGLYILNGAKVIVK